MIHPKQGKGVESAVVRFFDKSKITDPNAQIVADLILRKENNKPFIKDFVKYGGYPIWGSAVVTSGRSQHTSTLGRNSNEEETEVLIPFALENDSSVNSILQVKMNSTDTTFKLLYKCHYSVNGYRTQDAKNNADDFALLFMAMERQTFGHSTFTILDSALFAKNTNGPEHKLLRIKSVTSGGDVAARDNFFTLTICYEIMVAPNEGQLTGCKPGEPCNDPVKETVCDTKIYFFPEGPGGGGGGIDEGEHPTPLPGDVDGGGGYSTPGTPNPNDPINGDWNNNPCLPGKRCDKIPGWEPIENVDFFKGKELAPDNYFAEHYWEEPSYDDNEYINPVVNNPTYDQDGYRKNGPVYNYKGGSVQNYTNDNGGKYAIFTKDNGEKIKFPGATITDFGVPQGKGATTSNGGIHADLSFDLPNLQHEYGHYLQAKYYGSLLYNTMIVPASVWSAATTSSSSHRHFWTEVDANQFAISFFGNNSAIAQDPNRFPR